MKIRSAIYLAGNKYRLWEQLAPFLKGDSHTLVDVFGGSGIITINAATNKMFQKYVYNEKLWYMCGMQKWIKKFDLIDQDEVMQINEDYPKTKEGFLQMRRDYNENWKYIYHLTYPYLYNLMCRSNSNMMRFSSNGYNMTYGERHRCDIDRILNHSHVLNTNNVEIVQQDFRDLLNLYLDPQIKSLEEITYYFDPPYANTTATYNENGGWTEKDNEDLFNLIVDIHNKGGKIVISNVFTNRDKDHTFLIDWCDKHQELFDVHHLNMCYNNSSFRKSKSKTDEVVIVSKNR